MVSCKGQGLLSMLFTAISLIPKAVSVSKLVEPMNRKHLLSAYEVSDILLNTFA